MVLIERDKPKSCSCCWYDKICKRWMTRNWGSPPPADCPLKEIPQHGDLIDRDALIKDGWLNLHKEVIRMGGYAIHELPLTNPSIPVIIPASEEEPCTKN